MLSANFTHVLCVQSLLSPLTSQESRSRCEENRQRNVALRRREIWRRTRTVEVHHDDVYKRRAWCVCMQSLAASVCLSPSCSSIDRQPCGSLRDITASSTLPLQKTMPQIIICSPSVTLWILLAHTSARRSGHNWCSDVNTPLPYFER